MPIRSFLCLLCLCMLLVCCGRAEPAASIPSTAAVAYPAPLASAYSAPTPLPPYPAPTQVQALNVTVIVDLPASHLGIVYNQSLTILAVDSDSPAAHAMLQAGDQIHKINDHVVTTPEQFQQLVEPLLASTTFTITIERAGSTLQQTIVPGWLPEPESTPHIRSTVTPVPADLYYR
jgi:membrane-associated protease RseP (regulator of RpoE activity)